jgi:acyl-CoA thioesterase
VLEFDRATALSGDGPVFETALGDGWNGVTGANGGFMLALATRALGRVVTFPDPIVVSGFFLRPGSIGPAEISTEVIRSGKTTAFGQASLWREGKEVLRATAAFADLAAAAARGGGRLSYSGGAAPDLPPPQECLALPARARSRISLINRFEYRVAALPSWAVGDPPSGVPVYELWIRFADGREPDVMSLPLIVDAVAPAVLEVGARSATVELTVHLRARPAPGWLACRSLTRHLADGYHEEDFEVWDSTGRLVAQSRQLAVVVG